MATQRMTKPILALRGLPVLGSLAESNKDRLGFMLRVAHECGDIGSFRLGPFTAILLNTSELVHAVLVEHAYDFDKGTVIHKAFRPVFGNGLLNSEGDLHRRQRKLMAPAFQPRHIVTYAQTMVSYAQRMQEGWNDGATIDIGHEMTKLTMSIVGKVLFDAEVFTESDELGAAITSAIEHMTYVSSHLFPLPLSWPIPRHQRTRRALALLKSRMQEMIDERRESSEEKDDLLSILLQTREEDGSCCMNDEQIRDEAVTLFGAGHETTATALTWAWYLLARHVEVYQQVQQEVDRVLQGRIPTYADLASLPYTLQVLKETMRLYPPLYAFGRVALHDVEVDDYVIRAKQGALISPYTLHRRPDYFPDPEQFEPGRFTPENEKRLPRYAYLPFSAGPRICIGNHFALMEGHLLLATLVQHVTFEVVPGQRIELDPQATLRPKAGIKMVVRRRNAAN